MPTLISHFYNEAYLLKWWLPHHKRLFDHGILIDYDSTDNSREIIRQFCPTWEVRTSRNREFQAHACDEEVSDIERGVSGWKMTLTTTEFLLCGRPLAEIIADAQKPGIAAHPVGICDSPQLWDVEPDALKSLMRQRTFGFANNEFGTYDHGRLIHCTQDARYSLGRHGFGCEFERSTEIAVAWLMFSPMTPEGRSRKTQIRDRMAQRDVDGGLGFQHVDHATEEGLRQGWERPSNEARNLMENEWYARMINRLPRRITYPKQVVATVVPIIPKPYIPLPERPNDHSQVSSVEPIKHFRKPHGLRVSRR